jgi:tetratricopeptide (TPR) repeat protein
MEAMKGFSLRVSPRSAWKLVERLEGGLLILLLCSLLCGIAKGDDNAPSDEASPKSETPASGPSDSTPLAQRMTLEIQAAELAAKAVKLLEEGSLEEAVTTKRQHASMYASLRGASHWQTKSEQALLSELEHASRLPAEQQKTYVAAYHALADSGQKAALGQYGDAEAALGNSLDDFTKVLGENFLSVATALERLGILHGLKDNPNENLLKAKAYFLRAAAIWKMIGGEDHPGCAIDCSLAASMCIEAKEFDQAETLLRDALVRLRRILGAENPEYAGALGNLSRVLIEKKSYLEAEALGLQAISILEETQSQNGLPIALCLSNLAEVNIAFEEYRAADKNLGRSLAIHQSVLPPRSPFTAKVLDRYAWLLRKMNRPEEAKAMETRAEAARFEFRPTAR